MPPALLFSSTASGTDSIIKVELSTELRFGGEENVEELDTVVESCELLLALPSNCTEVRDLLRDRLLSLAEKVEELDTVVESCELLLALPSNCTEVRDLLRDRLLSPEKVKELATVVESCELLLALPWNCTEVRELLRDRLLSPPAAIVELRGDSDTVLDL